MEKLTPYQTVLVLNASYEPIHFTNWKRAIILLLKEKAQIVSKSVIRLLKYVHIPIAKIVYERPPKSLIYKRDGNKCQYCGSTKNLTIDHVIPKSKSGKDTWDNLVVACSPCNSKKGDRLLEETDMKLIRRPKAPVNKSMIQLGNTQNAEWQEYIFG